MNDYKEIKLFQDYIVNHSKYVAECLDREMLKQALKGKWFFEAPIIFTLFNKVIKIPFIKIKTNLYIKPFTDVVLNNNIKTYEELVEYHRKGELR